MGEDNLTPADHRQIQEVEQWASLLQRGRTPHQEAETGRAIPELTPLSPTYRPQQRGGLRGWVVCAAGGIVVLLILLVSAETVGAGGGGEVFLDAQRRVADVMPDNALACCLLAVSFGSDTTAAHAATSSQTTTTAEEDARREFKHLQAIPGISLRRLAVDKGILAGMISNTPLSQVASRCGPKTAGCPVRQQTAQAALANPESIARYVPLGRKGGKVLKK